MGMSSSLRRFAIGPSGETSPLLGGIATALSGALAVDNRDLVSIEARRVFLCRRL